MTTPVEICKRVTNLSRFIGMLIPFVAIAATAFGAPKIPHYNGGGSIIIGGEAKWDYCAVDSVHRRLYVSHGSSVTILNLETRAVIGEIPNQHGVHGIAFAQEFNKGFISNGGDNSVTVFDLVSMKATNNVHIDGLKPDAIVYDPFTKRIFTFNGGSKTATAIDAKNDAIAGTVKLDGAPEFATSDAKGKMYVNLEDANAVNEFDPRTLKVLAKWPLAPCETPTGMAIDREHHRLFVGGRNKILAVMDATSGAIVKTLPIDPGCDAVVFEPSSQTIFSSNGFGSVTQIVESSPTEFRIVDTIPTVAKARTMALDEATHMIYLPTMVDQPVDPVPDVAQEKGKKSFGVVVLNRNN